MGKYKRAAITTVPDPTPSTPCVKPAPKPPKATNINYFDFERSIYCFNPYFLYFETYYLKYVNKFQITKRKY
jgi:hypothetical protein